MVSGLWVPEMVLGLWVPETRPKSLTYRDAGRSWVLVCRVMSRLLVALVRLAVGSRRSLPYCSTRRLPHSSGPRTCPAEGSARPAGHGTDHSGSGIGGAMRHVLAC